MQKTIALVLIFFISCKQESLHNLQPMKDYVLINDEGIYVEKFDATNRSDNRFTDNNLIYKQGLKFVFDYYYEDRNGDKFKFKQDEEAIEKDPTLRGKAWEFVLLENATNETINTVELSVKEGLEPFIKRNPDYNQTIIQYKYPQVDSIINFSSKTGVIENENNIWIHPPRSHFFRILEINPFPFIQRPYEIGNKWNWSLMIGSSWGDERWKTWETSIENNYDYEIIDQKIIQTALGRLKCLVINSTASSEIGKTHLLAYFNEKFGFVKLDFTNIDSTKTILKLKSKSVHCD